MPTCEGAYALYVAAAAYERGPPLSPLTVELSYTCVTRQHTSAHACIWPGSELWPGGTLGIYIYMLLSALSVCVTVHKECSKYYRGLPKTDHSYSFFGSRGGACRAAKRRAEVE